MIDSSGSGSGGGGHAVEKVLRGGDACRGVIKKLFPAKRYGFAVCECAQHEGEAHFNYSDLNIPEHDRDHLCVGWRLDYNVIPQERPTDHCDFRAIQVRPVEVMVVQCEITDVVGDVATLNCRELGGKRLYVRRRKYNGTMQVGDGQRESCRAAITWEQLKHSSPYALHCSQDTPLPKEASLSSGTTNSRSSASLNTTQTGHFRTPERRQTTSGIATAGHPYRTGSGRHLGSAGSNDYSNGGGSGNIHSKTPLTPAGHLSASSIPQSESRLYKLISSTAALQHRSTGQHSNAADSALSSMGGCGLPTSTPKSDRRPLPFDSAEHSFSYAPARTAQPIPLQTFSPDTLRLPMSSRGHTYMGPSSLFERSVSPSRRNLNNEFGHSENDSGLFGGSGSAAGNSLFYSATSTPQQQHNNESITSPDLNKSGVLSSLSFNGGGSQQLIRGSNNSTQQAFVSSTQQRQMSPPAFAKPNTSAAGASMLFNGGGSSSPPTPQGHLSNSSMGFYDVGSGGHNNSGANSSPMMGGRLFLEQLVMQKQQQLLNSAGSSNLENSPSVANGVASASPVTNGVCGPPGLAPTGGAAGAGNNNGGDHAMLRMSKTEFASLLESVISIDKM